MSFVSSDPAFAFFFSVDVASGSWTSTGTSGVLSGVAIALAATLALLLWQASNPHDALLGRIPGHEGLYKLHHHPEARPIPGLVIYLPQSALVLFNVDYLMQRLLDSARELPAKGSWLILDASAISHIDTTSVLALAEAQAELARRGIALAVAELHAGPPSRPGNARQRLIAKFIFEHRRNQSGRHGAAVRSLLFEFF